MIHHFDFRLDILLSFRLAVKGFRKVTDDSNISLVQVICLFQVVSGVRSDDTQCARELTTRLTEVDAFRVCVNLVLNITNTC